MRITFRIDDVSPYMNWDNFRRLVGIFGRYGVKPLLGVIPDNRDRELVSLPYNAGGWDEIRALKDAGWLMAQHGCRHLYTRLDAGLLGINRYSEFAGVGPEEQRALLEEGKQLLEALGLGTDIFMAPAHSYDRNTLLALRQLGFRYVTDGYGLFPYRICGLKFIPCQTSRPKRLPAGLVTVCLHPNTMSEVEFRSLEGFVASNPTIACDFTEAIEYPAPPLAGRVTEKLVLLARRVGKRRG